MQEYQKLGFILVYMTSSKLAQASWDTVFRNIINYDHVMHARVATFTV